MRIVIANKWYRSIGGIESYLLELIPLLKERGHDIGLLCEYEGDSDRPVISTDPAIPVWRVEQLGTARALSAVRHFCPDVIFSHGIENLKLEKEVLQVARSVAFVHVFRGTCISSEKMHKFPVALPCNRKFGRACLLQYLPRRCGGLSPLTMIERYKAESSRLLLLRRYTKVICASSFMADELQKHGIAAEAVQLLVPVARYIECSGTSSAPIPNQMERWKLAFVGRMEYLKGCRLFIEALTMLTGLTNPLDVTFIGDGSELPKLRAIADQSLRAIDITFRFTGWISKQAVAAALADTHLLVFPSIWPEPFGLSGIEAGIHSVPTVAFDVGGVRDWLTDGLNGYVAPGRVPTARSLANAILQVISDGERYLRLRAGAQSAAKRFSRESHVDRIVNLLEDSSTLSE